jgi:hypothetical protein
VALHDQAALMLRDGWGAAELPCADIPR